MSQKNKNVIDFDASMGIYVAWDGEWWGGVSNSMGLAKSLLVHKLWPDSLTSLNIILIFLHYHQDRPWVLNLTTNVLKCSVLLKIKIVISKQ